MSESQANKIQDIEKEASWQKKMVTLARFVKITAFLTAAAVFFVFLNSFFFPFRKDWSNYDTLNGLYTQPENSIDVLFMGTSMVLCGINPMEMYENYGVSAYNVGSEQQSVLASYYWAKEIYKYNKDSLRTLVLDVSGLRSSRSEKFFHKTIEPMRLGDVKLEAARRVAVDFEDFLSYTMPLYQYHDRWASIDETDYIKYSTSPLSFKRGYCYYTKRAVTTKKLDELGIFSSRLTTDTFDPDSMNKEEEQALDMLKEWCDQEGLELVLIKLPQRSWSSADRNYVLDKAQKLGVPYLDLKYGDLMDAARDLDMGLDTIDRQHYNYDGANIVSNLLAGYLVREGYADDVREDPDYAFMEDYLRDFKDYTLRSRLSRIVSPVEYLREVMPGRTVFITVKDDAQRRLGEDTQESLRGMGLKELSDLKFHDSYLAVIEDGRVVKELRASEKPEDDVDEDVAAQDEELVTSVSYVGECQDGKSYSLKSAGYNSGNISSCVIGVKEESKNGRGLNIVVYDPRLHEVVDSTVFDTYSAGSRLMDDLEYGMELELARGVKPTDLPDAYRKCYLYLLDCENLQIMQTVKETVDSSSGLLQYLEAFADNSHVSLFMAVKGDGASALTPEVRKTLKKRYGLEKLAKLEPGASYVGVSQGGAAIHEETAASGKKVQYKEYGATITSSAGPDKEKASCTVGGQDKAMNKRGINIVVYDHELGSVVDSVVFDTGAVAQKELK